MTDKQRNEEERAKALHPFRMKYATENMSLGTLMTVVVLSCATGLFVQIYAQQFAGLALYALTVAVCVLGPLMWAENRRSLRRIHDLQARLVLVERHLNMNQALTIHDMNTWFTPSSFPEDVTLGKRVELLEKINA